MHFYGKLRMCILVISLWVLILDYEGVLLYVYLFMFKNNT